MKVKSRKSSFYFFGGGMIFFVLFFYSPNSLGQTTAYKQIRIPFNKLLGVPFTKDPEGNEYTTEGFDIDSSENFYFLGGEKATLACFSKDGKSIYRKTFPNFVPGQVQILANKLYFFASGYKNLNTLVEIDKSNGSLIQAYPKTITNALKSYGYKQIYYYDFVDSLLQITYIDSEGIEKPKKRCFDLKGEPLSSCDQRASSDSAIENERKYRFLGKLGNYYVLGKFNDDDNNKYDLSLRDSSNSVISNSFVDLKYVGGRPFCGTDCAPPEHRKLRNNKLYMLNRDKNMAVITEIDLAAIFHKQ
jgi:hypothetical protein